MIYVFRYLLISIYTVFWGGLGCVLGVLDRSGESVIWVARNWLHWILVSCGVRVEATGHVPPPDGGPFVVMSNHQSAFDIPALVEVFKPSWRFVAKRELTWIPFFGWALAIGGHVIIDRSNRERAVQSLAAAAERIRSGTNVVIYPEGTRSPDGQLRAFKSGGFHLAIAAGAPILPVSVSGSRRVTPSHSLRIESGRIRVHFGEPIPTQGLSSEDRDLLKGRVRDAIIQGFDADLQRPALDEVPGAATARS